MGCRMALRAFLILPQLPLRPLPGFWINERRHWDGNPLARRPSGPALEYSLGPGRGARVGHTAGVLPRAWVRL